MPEPNSVTQWIDGLKRGDEEAARQLWERYFQRMVAAGRNKLQRSRRRVADEEDVAIGAFDSLCRGAAEGRFTRLKDRVDLWPLLLTLTAQKAIDQIRRENRQRRGGGKVRGDSVLADVDVAIDRFARQQPTPEFMALVDEQYTHLMAQLRDDTLRRIVQWKMEGHTHEHIATSLGISIHAVGRKLRMVRVTWSQELNA